MATKLTPLVDDEIIGQNQFTHYMELKAADIPAGMAVATAWTFVFGTAYKYNRVNNVAVIVQQPFSDPADAANNSTLLDVGDAAATNGYIAAAQINGNSGALIKIAWKTGATAVPKDYAADTTLDFILTPPAGKTLSNLKRGSVMILFNLFKLSPPFDTDSV
jgi:hypothetical protein